MSEKHQEYMRLALELGRRGEGRTRPNPAVGSVVVRDGRVAGEGFHPRAGEPHAEIFALREAGEEARGADLYVTLEPCCHQGRTGPCVDAILAAGVARVFIGAVDPNPRVAGGGIARLEAAGVGVEMGILEGECRRLIAPFAKHVTTGLPHVTLKAALTLDGRTGTAGGDSQWISGPASREHVHRLRDRVDAIMVGIGTVLQDDPRLTTRLPEGSGRDPLRIVVDSDLRLPEVAAVLQDPANVLIAVTRKAPPEKIKRLLARGVEVVETAEREGRVDLIDLMRQLGARGIQSLLLEGGATLDSAALQARVVDRVMFFFAPILLGGSDGRALFDGVGAARLADAVRLTDLRVERFGDDVLIEGEIIDVHRPD